MIRGRADGKIERPNSSVLFVKFRLVLSPHLPLRLSGGEGRIFLKSSQLVTFFSVSLNVLIQLHTSIDSVS